MPRIQQVMTAGVYNPAVHNDMLPLFGTPKVDGIRFYIQDSKVWTRSNKLLPNRHLQALLPLYLPEGTDGELVDGPHGAEDHFQRSTSVCMSFSNSINSIHVFAFDRLSPEIPFIPRYLDRIAAINKWFKEHSQLWLAGELAQHTDFSVLCDYILSNKPPPERKVLRNSIEGQQLDDLHRRTIILTPTAIRKPTDVDKYLNICLAQGYEGIMLRRGDGDYKFGRSTEKEALLLKYKPFTDSEALIIGFEELMHNDNPQSTSEIGKSRRSSSFQGKRAGGTLGSFLVRDVRTGLEFSIGGGKGLTAELRQEVWNNQATYRNATIKYSYLEVGTKPDGKPRMPKFLGFRDSRDL